MSLHEIGRILVIAGLGLVAVGVVVLVAGRLGLGRLPGDLHITRGNLRIVVPLATSLLVSVVATVLLNLFLRR
jgi:hypothetical protein